MPLSEEGSAKMRLRNNWVLHLVFLVYTVLIILVASKHEPWADEAQAWLQARDSSLWTLLFRNLHYEGHPPLWHLVLMLPSRLLPYGSMKVVSVLFAAAGTYVFLRYSPFPKIMKVLLPFSYFPFYQYGVIARCYVLVPLLLFLIARIYRDKVSKVYHFVLLLCLLANVCAYTTLMAVSIMFVHLVDLAKMRSELSRDVVMRQIKAYAVFVAAIVLIAVQIWQPQDSSFAPNYTFSIQRFCTLPFAVFSFSMTEIRWVSAIVLAVSLAWFWQKRVLLLYAALTLPVLASFCVKYYNDWHQGIVFMTWIFVMWLSFQQRDRGRRWALSAYGRRAVTFCAVAVLGVHIYWAAAASIADYRGSYSAGKAVADYIKANKLEEKKICATTFYTTSIQPYFKENIFDNHNDGKNPSFWLLSRTGNRMEDMEAILQAKPDLIIMGRPRRRRRPRSRHRRRRRRWSMEGYKLEGVFEGDLYWKDRIKEKNDIAVFRRKSDDTTP